MQRFFAFFLSMVIAAGASYLLSLLGVNKIVAWLVLLNMTTMVCFAIYRKTLKPAIVLLGALLGIIVVHAFWHFHGGGSFDGFLTKFTHETALLYSIIGSITGYATYKIQLLLKA
ncbi:hypothetical protein BN938_0061 [Mucinivorans hirudinis]|uniref:Uncharacterized protein n=1 Tax=Mucinivorans hirudinis TaxID=1433126 RepID=A0A060R8U8_9BACT|nr:hypothetical protein BN938_0061 [Mucinivorans hirudinis]